MNFFAASLTLRIKQASSKLEETVIRLKERQAETLAEISKVDIHYPFVQLAQFVMYKTGAVLWHSSILHVQKFLVIFFIANRYIKITFWT